MATGEVENGAKIGLFSENYPDFFLEKH